MEGVGQNTIANGFRLSACGSLNGRDRWRAGRDDAGVRDQELRQSMKTPGFKVVSWMLLPLLGLGYVVAQEAAPPDGVTQAKPAVERPDPTKRRLTDHERIQQQKDLRNELKGDYKKWLEQDVRWIITDTEAQAFKHLSNDEERDAFIESFWQRRNPSPDSPDNEYRDEIYARIQYANEHFAAGKPEWPEHLRRNAAASSLPVHSTRSYGTARCVRRAMPQVLGRHTTEHQCTPLDRV